MRDRDEDSGRGTEAGSDKGRSRQEDTKFSCISSLIDVFIFRLSKHKLY